MHSASRWSAYVRCAWESRTQNKRQANITRFFCYPTPGASHIRTIDIETEVSVMQSIGKCQVSVVGELDLPHHFRTQPHRARHVAMRSGERCVLLPPVLGPFFLHVTWK